MSRNSLTTNGADIMGPAPTKVAGPKFSIKYLTYSPWMSTTRIYALRCYRWSLFNYAMSSSVFDVRSHLKKQLTSHNQVGQFFEQQFVSFVLHELKCCVGSDVSVSDGKHSCIFSSLYALTITMKKKTVFTIRIRIYLAFQTI